MSLKKQKQKIIEEFRELDREGVPPEALRYIFLPYLEIFAKELGFSTAYFWSHPQKSRFAMIQLQSVQNPSKTKRVLYIFASEQDAKRHPHYDRTIHRIDKLPILSCLLQFLTASDLDSAVFYPQKGKMSNSKELEQRTFQKGLEDLCENVAAKLNNQSTDPVA